MDVRPPPTADSMEELCCHSSQQIRYVIYIGSCTLSKEETRVPSSLKVQDPTNSSFNMKSHLNQTFKSPQPYKQVPPQPKSKDPPQPNTEPLPNPRRNSLPNPKVTILRKMGIEKPTVVFI
ncbi:hypothetical protein AC249_AIPGENE4670 [Exaiptasia diaphana]|nr:hypothetical protein AC249_AIPGENE4670 [Exaiptasia diaphana]